MSRYRKIEVRTWSDERFRSLSPLPPSGQGLWFFLLTGPHTGPIPGLFRSGRAAMSEELGWDVEAFDEAFREVSSNGMAKADFKAKLVWLPNAIKHNKPESPNVVRSWRVEIDLLPECDLKREALIGIRESLESIGPSYVSAFDEIFSEPARKPSPKPSGKPSAKAMPNQEQEQEQNKEDPPLPPGGGDGFAGDAAPQKKRRARGESKTFAQWIEAMRSSGERPVSDYRPVWDYASDVGIRSEFIEIAWLVFRKRFLEEEKAKRKRYIDRRQTFLNYVRSNYLKLWFWSAKDNCWSLTTVGVQADREHHAEVAA